MGLQKCKTIISIALALIFTVSTAVPAFAGSSIGGGAGGVPYRGFTYDSWSQVVPSPAAYVPTITIGAPDIDPSLGLFKVPEDMYVDKNGDIYLLDTGNNRLVIFDRNLHFKRIIDSFDNGGSTDTFKNPCGVTVTKNLDIYIADTENERIVILTNEGKLIKIMQDPQDETLEATFKFAPSKVCVDHAGRVYAIVKNVVEGIMSFSEDGTFIGYFGTINVNYTPVDWIWRQLSTSAQRSRQRLFVPVEFASMDIDDSGFIYTTNIDVWEGNKVKRLNPAGADVLVNYNRGQNIIGDMRSRATGRLGGRAMFVDIKSRPNGVYTALDSSRGRLFTYDGEGNLLYTISGTGNILGMSRQPVAVEVLDDNILVLDKLRGEIVYYEQTEYGRLINEAIALRYDGDESAAVRNWELVLKLNENYTLAYVGIGKALLAAGDNREAMAYLKKGMNVEYYSLAFKRFRNDVLKDNLSLVLTLLLIAVLAFTGYRIYKGAKTRRLRLEAERAENAARAARAAGRESVSAGGGGDA